jgi:hypothetical protein
MMTGMALVLASVTAFAAMPARAQESKTPMQIIDEARANERLQVEKQYDAIKSRETPSATKSGKRDPWAGARSADVGTSASNEKTPASKPPRREAKKDSKRAGKPLKLH